MLIFFVCICCSYCTHFVTDEINLKWTRPLQKCSVGADLPRLGNKHEIRNEKGEVIFPPPSGLNDHDHFPTVKELFHSLAKYVDLINNS